MKAIATCLLNFRKGPSKEAEIIAVLKPGEAVTIKEQTGDWWKVTYKRKNGYIMAKFAEVQNDEAGRAE